MEISKQIKKYRLELHLSQEDLAERVFVTRQSISNWENAKNYPDIHSLLLLSTLFEVSLDNLVKGDLEVMKEQIKTEDIQKLNRDSMIFIVLMLVTVLSAFPLFLYASVLGVVLWCVIAGTMLFYAIRLEKQKKRHDMQTYKEILAFTEGKQLDEIEQGRERAKRPYQAVLYAMGAAAMAAIIILIMWKLFL